MEAEQEMAIVLLIFLIAVYNATATAMKWPMRWTIALYWAAVAVYWMTRAKT